jgi:hypothetical protein
MRSRGYNVVSLGGRAGDFVHARLLVRRLPPKPKYRILTSQNSMIRAGQINNVEGGNDT